MGYDLTNFVEKVDDEFQCQICTLVLEHPVETPCEHFFCSECIEGWLSVNGVCPVDRLPLTSADLRHPNRLMRSLIGKLDIRCDFHVDGCLEIVRLDNLKKHLSTCIYRPNAKVTCDKGCNQYITRREYVENSCYAHLENKVRCQHEEIAKLNDEVIQLREEVTKHNDVVARLPSSGPQLTKLRFFYKSPPAWHKCVNMKIQCDGPVILENDDKSMFSLAQSAYSLLPSFPYFKVHILKSALAPYSTTIGLTRAGPSNKPLGYHKGTYGYRSDGATVSNTKFEYTTEKWEEGDLITCGVTFQNRGGAPSTDPMIYFHRNDIEIKRYFVNLSQLSGLFPTVNVYMQT